MTQREIIDSILPASARDMAKYTTDPRWAAQLIENDQAQNATVGAGGETAVIGGQPAPFDSRVVEGVDGSEVAVESDIETQKPRTEKPEPKASRVEAAEASTPKRDGRHFRKDRSRYVILRACRDLMRGGTFRPTMVEICRAAECSVRTGFQLFATVEAIHVEAIADPRTREVVLDRLIDSTLSAAEIDNVICAIIRGR